jgi:hypothetical protein
LLSALLEVPPNTDAWSSASWDWDRKRPKRVDGLPDKLRTVVAWGAKTFHVAPSQFDEADDWVRANAPGRLEVRPLGDPVAVPVKVIRGLVSALTTLPPVPDETAHPDVEAGQFARCVDFWLALEPFSEADRRFYPSHLRSGIVRRLRSKFRGNYPAVHVRRFVTIVSESEDLAVITAGAVSADRTMLLHTGGEFRKKAEAVAQVLGGEPNATIREFNDGRMDEDIRRLVAEFTTDVPPDEVMFDLKPGTKRMSYALLAVAEPGCRILNLEPHFRKDRRNTPGTEIPELLPAISRHPSENIA